MSAVADIARAPFVTRTRAALERAWERIDGALLRLQGRVDTPGWDRGLPYAFAALHAAALITAVLARHNSMLHGLETAKFSQATWQIAEGLRPITTLADGNVIAEQGSLILYPLGLLTAILPRVETLLVVKALALAAAMIPLWRLARRHGRLGIGATSAVVLVYGLYAAVHAMNAADFAPAVLAVPALCWAVLFGFDERERLMLASIVFVLCCRADLGLAVAGLGVLLWLERKRRLGRLAIGVGLGWFLVMIYVVQPWLGDGSYAFLEPYYEFGETPLGVLWGIIAHPWRFLKLVGSIGNFQVLVSLLAPVLFLPLTAPRFLMPAVPLYVLYMGADVDEGRLREAAQTVPITAFVFVATIFALQRAGRTLVKQVRVERRIILALLLTGIVFFIRDSPSSPYASPWEWGDRDSVDQARLDAIEELPGIDVPVRASSSMLPLLSERLGVYALDTRGFETLDDVVDAAASNVDWILLARDDLTLDAEELNQFRVRLNLQGWDPVQRDNETGIEIFKFTGIITPEEFTLAQETEDTSTTDEGVGEESDGDDPAEDIAD